MSLLMSSGDTVECKFSNSSFTAVGDVLAYLTPDSVCSHSAIGSTGGRNEFMAKDRGYKTPYVDFGASDVAMPSKNWEELDLAGIEVGGGHQENICCSFNRHMY